jgi:hypothetical protein
MAVAVIAAPWPEIVALIGTGPPNFSVPVSRYGTYRCGRATR